MMTSMLLLPQVDFVTKVVEPTALPDVEAVVAKTIEDYVPSSKVKPKKRKPKRMS